MGRYKVRIQSPEPYCMSREEVAHWPPVAGKYLSAETSGLEFTIERGTNTCDIALELLRSQAALR